MGASSEFELVLLRHGESQWNKENRFTGWTDVPLSEKGQSEAIQAGKWILDEGLEFDFAYTSVLKRAIHTLWKVLDETNQSWIPVERSWRLNERHYGELQGLNKTETAEKFGSDQVHIWRRSFDIPPGKLGLDDKRHPKFDRRYQGISLDELPSTEALKQCQDRVLPYWTNVIAPKILSNQKCIIVAHGNSLRALIKHLDQISDKDIMELNIPTGIPLVYKLDKNLNPISNRYLGDPESAKRAADAVANQAKK